MQQDATRSEKRWFVYMVECADGTIYTGCTTDVDRRVREHNTSSRGARYTRSRRPVRLLISFPMHSRSEALREEIRVKRLPRSEKLKMTSSDG